MPYQHISRKPTTKKSPNELVLDQKMAGTSLKKIVKNYNIAAIPIKEDMIDAVGGEENLYGLKYMTKTQESFERKVTSDQQKYYPRYTSEQVATTVQDAIRFTQIVSKENFATEVNKTFNKLKQKGYKCIRVYNSWLAPLISYKGVNALFRTPYGYTCELQFHTKESMETKDKSHEYYEEYRLDSTSQKRKDELKKIMAELSSELVSKHTPTGVNEIDGRFVTREHGLTEIYEQSDNEVSTLTKPHTTEIQCLWDINKKLF